MSTEERGEARKRDHGGWWALLCLLMGLVGLVAAPAALAASNPPHGGPVQFIIGVWGLLLIGLVFWRSALRPRWLAKVSFVVATLLALVVLCALLLGYLEENGDFPWLVLAPVLSGLIVGGWAFRQRWLSVALGVAVIYCTTAALLPPRAQDLPWSQTLGGLTATLQSVDRGEGGWCSCDFLLRTAPGTDVRMAYDMGQVETSPHFWESFSVSTINSSVYHLPDEPPRPRNEAELHGRFGLPKASRRFDLSIELSPWPAHPQISVQIPIPPPHEGWPGIFTAHAGATTLEVSDVRWTLSKDRIPSEPCLAFSWRCSGPVLPNDSWGWNWRLSDAAGHFVSRVEGSYFSDRQMETEKSDEQIYDLNPAAGPLTLGAFSAKEMVNNRVKFTFSRLPNPRSTPSPPCP